MTIKLYHLDHKAECFEYLTLWRSSKSRRPHDHPQYMHLMRRKNQVPCAIAYFEDGIPKILYAFYMMDIGQTLEIESLNNNIHLVSSYGYGGPIFLDDKNANLFTFESELSNLFSSLNVISEFVREDLFDDYKVARNTFGDMQQHNVVVGLNKSSEDVWSNYKYSVQKNIKRAIKSNLNVVYDFEGARVNDFVNIYHMTMARTNADQFFMIPLEKFIEFNVALLEDRIGFYVHVLYKDEVVATELLLRSPEYLYSFLGGSNMDFYLHRPSDFLKHSVNIWAVENSIKGYVLGGGFKPYDGIYNFKLAFDPSGANPFFVQRRILDMEAYNNAVNLRKNESSIKCKDWNPNPSYFPAYFS